jgi:hypothetical protein
MAKFKASADAVSDESVNLADDAAVAVLGDDQGPGHEVSVPLAKVGEVSGEFSRSDFSIPLLQIVQNVGPLSRVPGLKPGDVVVAKEVVIAHDSEPWKFVALSITKYFQERLKYDPNGPRPLRFNTEAEVREANLTLEWVNNGPGKQDTPPTAEPVAVIAMLIRRPEGNTSPVFSVPFSGADWALCQWIVQRTLYKVAKRLFTARATELAEKGLLSGLWQVVVRDAIAGGNVIKAPTLALVGRCSDEEIAELKTKFS